MLFVTAVIVKRFRNTGNMTYRMTMEIVRIANREGRPMSGARADTVDRGERMSEASGPSRIALRDCILTCVTVGSRMYV